MVIEQKKELEQKIAELEKQVKRLQVKAKKSKYGLVWLDIPEALEDDAENKLAILKELTKKTIVSDDSKPTHILIEGDNHSALTCLNYTHKEKVDVIYIDPPYNTGSDEFKYRDKRILDKFPDGTPVPKDHPLRHSYWLSFISKRLRLAKNLLKNSGVIFISINEEELFNLKLLCDQIFYPSNYLATFTIKVRHEDRILKGDKDFHEVVEYLLMYRKSKLHKTVKRVKDNTSLEDYKYAIVEKTVKPKRIQLGSKEVQVFQLGEYEIVKESPNEDNFKKINIRGTLKEGNSSGRFYMRYIDPIKDKIGCLYKVPNIGDDKFDFRYFLAPASKRKRNGDYFQGVPTTRKDRIAKPYPNYFDFEQDFNNVGYEGGVEFRNGKKPVNFLKHFIKIGSQSKNIIVLDFFAGSGSTAEAVMKLNSEDGGKRQVILATNNEENICSDVCYPRIRNVISGYISIRTGERVNGLGNSLKYYRTNFVGNHNIQGATDKDKIEVAYQAGEMLAIAENTLYEVSKNKYYQLFENEERYTAIYFSEDLREFDDFVKMVEKLEYPATIYIFSWGEDEFESIFEGMRDLEVKSIPQPILEIYKSIYNVG